MSQKTVFKVDFVRGQKRPRAATINGHTRVYKDKSDKVYEQIIASKFLEAGGNYYTGAHNIIINCFSPAPKRVKSDDFQVKPDADNIAKLVLDALNGVAFRDDACVVGLQVKKHRRSDAYTHAYMIITVEKLTTHEEMRKALKASTHHV